MVHHGAAFEINGNSPQPPAIDNSAFPGTIWKNGFNHNVGATSLGVFYNKDTKLVGWDSLGEFTVTGVNPANGYIKVNWAKCLD